MASPAAGARGRALVLAPVVCALALVALVAALSRGGAPSRAPTATPNVGVPASSDARTEPASARDVVDLESDRSGIAADVMGESGGPRLRGLLLDEQDSPLDGRTARVQLRGPLGQRLVLAVDGQGRFGPQRLVAGAWSVSASAPGHRSATRDVEVREDAALEPLCFVLPRVRVLEARVHAVGPGRDGDPDADLAALERLLSLRLAVAGDSPATSEPLAPWTDPTSGARTWRARFEPPSSRVASLELVLGGERILERSIAADQREVLLSVDPLDLAARLVELELTLVGPDGLPLSNLSQVFVVWEERVHLSGGQPGPEPWRARFEACPPGPATLRVVDVDGRRGEVDLFVPYESPARLEVALELVEPGRD